MELVGELKHRTYWQRLIDNAWQRRSVVWLSGVRRTGKTFLCRSLPNIEIVDCERKSIREALADPESFFERRKGCHVAIDEIHRLDNPSEVLKIAADYFPDVKVVATGSSTLGAKKKFRDTLTDRKTNIHLTPMMSQDLVDFGAEGMTARLYLGGLPRFFLKKNIFETDIQEWMDDYWAKDVQELFNLENRNAFQKFIELLFAQSGGMFEATRFSGPCAVTAPTIREYLRALEETGVAHIVRPFSSYKPTEIVSAPKVYGFDTGFVRHYKGWTEPKSQDAGLLWEHYVLNEIRARLQTHSKRIGYWRDKRGHEVDFVLNHGEKNVTAIECKLSPENFNPASINALRFRYPDGENFVVVPNMEKSYERTAGGAAGRVKFIAITDLPACLLSRLLAAEKVNLDDFEKNIFKPH